MMRQTRRAKGFKRFDHGEPIRTIDTRPIAFVFLLVALVALFAASQPRSQIFLIEFFHHDPFFDGLTYDGDAEVKPSIYTVKLDETGDLSVNDSGMDKAQFAQFLHDAANEETQPIIRFQPSPNTPYGNTLLAMRELSTHSLMRDRFCYYGFHRYDSVNTGTETTLGILSSYAPSTVFVEDCFAMSSISPQ